MFLKVQLYICSYFMKHEIFVAVFFSIVGKANISVHGLNTLHSTEWENPIVNACRQHDGDEDDDVMTEKKKRHQGSVKQHLNNAILKI